MIPRFLAVAAAGLLALPSAAFADDLDDLIESGPEKKDTVKSEKDALKNEQTVTVDTAEDDRKRVIKTLQRKNFMKIGRYEVGPHLGFVTNDPFVNRYLLGAGLTYHVTELFGVEFSGTFSPDFGEGDWKPITSQIINENQVTPDISKIEWFGNMNFQYSPFYGKFAIFGEKIIMFDLFGAFGTGIVNTRDDLVALQKENDPVAVATEKQFHPTLNYGGGLRVALSRSFALRIEGRGMSYIEVVESTTLEMKNNFMLLGSAQFFFPGME